LFSQPHSEIADLLSDLLRAEDTRRSARKRLRPNEIEQLRHLQCLHYRGGLWIRGAPYHASRSRDDSQRVYVLSAAVVAAQANSLPAVFLNTPDGTDAMIFKSIIHD